MLLSDAHGRRICFATGLFAIRQQARLLLWVSHVDFAMSAIGPLTLQQRTFCLAIDPLVLSMIQAPKMEHRIMRYGTALPGQSPRPPWPALPSDVQVAEAMRAVPLPTLAQPPCRPSGTKHGNLHRLRPVRQNQLYCRHCFSHFSPIVAAAIFLILELNNPFAGLIHVSGAPAHALLAVLGK
jgi:hypothetical protein